MTGVDVELGPEGAEIVGSGAVVVVVGASVTGDAVLVVVSMLSVVVVVEGGGELVDVDDVCSSVVLVEG